METIILIGIIIICTYYYIKNRKKKIKFTQNKTFSHQPSIGPFRRDVENKIQEKDLNKIFKFDLAGTHVPKIKKFFDNEAFGYMMVDIVPEPKNKFDANAIAVMYDNKVVGYVPKSHQKGVKKLLDQGNNFSYIQNISFRYDSARDYEYLDVEIAIPYKFE